MKEKIKIFFNSKILFLILGLFIGGTTCVFAVTYFPSNQVTYDNSTSTLKSTDVQGAIDELYETCSMCSKNTSGNYVYYRNTEDGPLYRVSIEGGSGKQIANIYSMKSYSVSQEYLYYTPSDGGIYKKSLIDGSTTTLSSVSGISEIIVYGDYVYYTVDNSRIYKISINGGDATTVSNVYSAMNLEID